tara:strand:+ start:290 stop:418 length:129 start_codon:yes stop_codon:yes gene_type:complete
MIGSPKNNVTEMNKETQTVLQAKKLKNPINEDGAFNTVKNIF